MRLTPKFLMAVFWLFTADVLLVVAAFESGVLPTGALVSDNRQVEFWLTIIAELLALALIPTALRMFRIRWVSRRLGTAEAVMRCELARTLMLCVPLFADTLLYYLYMNVSFGYLAIILFLCLFFIVPTEKRCREDVEAMGRS